MRRSVLLGSLALAAALVAQLQPASSQSTDMNAIKAANAAFYSALSARDVTAMEQIWAKDEHVSNIFSAAQQPTFGLSAIQGDYEGLFKRMEQASVVMTDPSVRQQGDLALVVGVETAQVKPPNGDLVKFFALATNVFVKREAQWLMVHHHTSRPPQ
jgi:ketosteroid isomerase-like protein